MVRLLELGNHSYVKKCMDCLEKILEARISVIPYDLLPKFIGVNLKGIIELLKSILNNNYGSLRVL